jgi:hypothetical protein
MLYRPVGVTVPFRHDPGTTIPASVSSLSKTPEGVYKFSFCVLLRKEMYNYTKTLQLPLYLPNIDK